MKHVNVRILAVSAALAFSLALSIPAHAQGAESTYKGKCAACHGTEGQGKPPVAPQIAGSTKTEAVLTKGGEPKAPHIKPMSSVTPEQATALAAFVKALK